MHEHGLAKELWPQFQQIAETQGLVRVRRIEMVVGMLHGVSADFLAHSFEHAFEGTSFEGAEVGITIVDPGEQYTPPGADEPQTANGWELLVTRFEGDE
jgi:Zn finger protein HypA/HybF involved in hydrogenase expression